MNTSVDSVIETSILTPSLLPPNVRYRLNLPVNYLARFAKVLGFNRRTPHAKRLIHFVTVEVFPVQLASQTAVLNRYFGGTTSPALSNTELYRCNHFGYFITFTFFYRTKITLYYIYKCITYLRLIIHLCTAV